MANTYSGIKEGSTAFYKTKFQDELGAAIPDASLLTLNWTLYNEADGTIINSRSNTDVYNAGPGTLDAGTGELTIVLSPSDNPYLASSKEVETHVSLLKFTYNSGAGIRTGIIEANLLVQKITNLPA